jgi:hypothetical protein
VSEWISVKDRLPTKFPESEKWVLGLLENGEQEVTCFDGKGWYDARDGWIPYPPGPGRAVTHWMPLPEAPK